MSTPKQQYYENLADSLIDKFNLRGIEGYYCETKEEALLTAKRFLTPGCSVSWGGSMTLEEIGLIDDLKNSDYTVFDRTTAKTQEEKDALYAEVSHCDYYFMSTNAISLDGQLVNVDGLGNRVASLIHGPKNVVIVAGMNKVEDGQQLVAEAPMSELFKYATDLRSMTQARGSFTTAFERYEEVPANVAQKIIESAKKDEDEEE